ncbi:MAG: hypothetical protein MI750_00480 [Xanthomonadales bacterium]|jgi:hypothetical protein|nr:hypothetical protein [Xanthomonadales bacterium]
MKATSSVSTLDLAARPPLPLAALGPIPDSSAAKWLKQWWYRLCHTPPWSLQVSTLDNGQQSVSLSHENKGLIRRWQGGHAELMLHHPCLQKILRGAHKRHLEQHQVAHLLMAAAATELMLRRLSSNSEHSFSLHGEI